MAKVDASSIDAEFGPEELRRRADQAWRQQRANGQAESEESGKADDPCKDEPGLDSVCGADIAQMSVEWVWPLRLARGKMTLLGGNPSTGKSQIATDTEARITQGMNWPDGGAAPEGSVVILSSEDSAPDTIIPRLDLAGANLRRVHIVRSSTEKGKARTFSLQKDMERLGSLIMRIGDVVLVRIDPITSYMGSDIDSHRTTDVRAVLEPAAAFAERMCISILAITHPPKGTQSRALNAFTGSLAYVAAARLAFVAAEEPETERRVLLGVKNNLGSLAPGIAYSIVPGINSKGISTSSILWDSAPVTVTADEAMAATAKDRKQAEREAEEFLRDLLGKGPVAADDGAAAAKREGIAERTLARARKTMGVIAEKEGFNAGWMWRLP